MKSFYNEFNITNFGGKMEESSKNIFSAILKRDFDGLAKDLIEYMEETGDMDIMFTNIFGESFFQYLCKSEKSDQLYEIFKKFPKIVKNVSEEDFKTLVSMKNAEKILLYVYEKCDIVGTNFLCYRLSKILIENEKLFEKIISREDFVEVLAGWINNLSAGFCDYNFNQAVEFLFQGKVNKSLSLKLIDKLSELWQSNSKDREYLKDGCFSRIVIGYDIIGLVNKDCMEKIIKVLYPYFTKEQKSLFFERYLCESDSYIGTVDFQEKIEIIKHLFENEMLKNDFSEILTCDTYNIYVTSYYEKNLLTELAEHKKTDELLKILDLPDALSLVERKYNIKHYGVDKNNFDIQYGVKESAIDIAKERKLEDVVNKYNLLKRKDELKESDTSTKEETASKDK